MSLINHEELLK